MGRVPLPACSKTRTAAPVAAAGGAWGERGMEMAAQVGERVDKGGDGGGQAAVPMYPRGASEERIVAEGESPAAAVAAASIAHHARWRARAAAVERGAAVAVAEATAAELEASAS